MERQFWVLVVIAAAIGGVARVVVVVDILIVVGVDDLVVVWLEISDVAVSCLHAWCGFDSLLDRDFFFG